MKVLITGAQFSNKGAQSLLYSIVSELNTRYKNIQIYYIPIDNFRKYNPDEYQFIITYDNKSYCDRKFNIIMFWKRYIKCILDSLEIIVKYKRKGVKKYSNVISDIDVLIDVSGFSLSDKFSRETNNRYLRYLKDAEKIGAKIILMPQSFGPFDYKSGKKQIESKIHEILPKVDLIFAREKEGKKLLENLFHLTNVELSCDIVLQTPDLEMDAITRNKIALDLPLIKTKHNVGIIPNEQTIRHGDEKKVLEVYREIVFKLISLKRHIYIFRHSNDLELCKKIYVMFEGNQWVHLITEEMDCMEYSKFIKNFDYIIASRYHAIVHGYKENVPAIILGWAIKYLELAENFKQQKYVFDINVCAICEVIDAIKNMDNHFIDEHKTIEQLRKEKMHNTCFHKCWELLDEISMQ